MPAPIPQQTHPAEIYAAEVTRLECVVARLKRAPAPETPFLALHATREVENAWRAASKAAEYLENQGRR